MKPSRKQLAQAVLNLVQDDPDHVRASQAVAAYLIEQRKTKELDSILRDIEKLRLEQNGVMEVTATSARPLSDKNKDAIKTLFEAKKIIINEERDESLVGGVRVRALQKSVDFSVQARLQRLKQGV